MNVIGYVRVSTQGQAKEGYSALYQQDEIRKLCKDNNWRLIDIYSDLGISGAKVDEEALEVEREGISKYAIKTSDERYRLCSCFKYKPFMALGYCKKC